jgi:hypothetical protein
VSVKIVAAYVLAAIVVACTAMYVTAMGPVFMPLVGSPRLDCSGVEEWRCEEAIHAYSRKSDGPVTYFKLEVAEAWPDCDSIEFEDPDDRDH